jgi:3-deoxy-D-manno-octulosonic-acid transferase
MTLLYNFSIALYLVLIKISAAFNNNKAQLWLKGRKDIFERMRAQVKTGERRIWVHASSLGEFEQGRPIIEKIRANYPKYKIVVTFFSPSGYEIRKDYPGADYIFYLPLDTIYNAETFVSIIHPEMVLFIKYEFWYHYIMVLFQKRIPFYLVSANFRDGQHFFQWYGGWFRKLLGKFNHIFVQNEKSVSLLNKFGINQVSISGDTRFDRVYSIASQARELPLVKEFVADKTCLIAGSTWEPDEDLLVKYINENNTTFKLIIAPHEMKENSIQELIKKLNKKVIRYSQVKEQDAAEADVLIIDNIGMLSSLYKYGQVAYIGGGFGKGIHNILEAATFGLPVIFGPNFNKFQEAINLMALEGAFSISNFQDVKNVLDELLFIPEKRIAAGIVSREFVKNNLGATQIIIEKVFRGL